MVGHLNDIVSTYSGGNAPCLPLCQKYKDLTNRVLYLNQSLEILSLRIQALSVHVNILKDVVFLNFGARRSTIQIKVPNPSPLGSTWSTKNLKNFMRYGAVFQSGKGPQS